MVQLVAVEADVSQSCLFTLVCEVDYRQKFRHVSYSCSTVEELLRPTRNLSSILWPLSLAPGWICSVVQLSDRDEIRVDGRHVRLGQISDHHIPLQDFFTVGALCSYAIPLCLGPMLIIVIQEFAHMSVTFTP